MEAVFSDKDASKQILVTNLVKIHCFAIKHFELQLLKR
ncbi:hypothetical protein BH10BAC3_BH10BAC3_15700 [soil metagenome]